MTTEQALMRLLTATNKPHGRLLMKGDEVVDGLKIVDGPWHQPGSSVLYLRNLTSGKRFRLEIKEAE